MSSVGSNIESLELFGQQIFHWHLELSSKCALKCPRCPRTQLPGRYKVTEINLDFIKKLFPLKRLSLVKKIIMSGGQGDPIYCNDFINIIRYFKESQPNIQLCIITNGSYKKSEWWKTVAQILNENDNIIFSVDGWDQESNEQYRVGSDFSSIMNGMQTLRQFNSKVCITWTTIIFKFNQERLNDMQDLAEEMGADSFNLVQSSLFGSIYPDFIDLKLGYDPLEPDRKYIEENTNRGFFVNFTERPVLQPTIKPTVFQFIEKNKSRYKDSYIVPLCRMGERGLYVDAEGILYPCSWISHPFFIQVSNKREKTISWEKSLFVEHKDSFNLNKYSLEEVLQNPFWKKLQCSWKSSKTAFVECERYCYQLDSAKKIARFSSKKSFNKKKINSISQTAEDYKENLNKKLKEVLKNP